MNSELTADYANLRSDVESILAQGQERARLVVEQIRVETYWEVGTRLVDYLEGREKTYGEQTLRRLAGDLGWDHRRLYDILNFRRRIEICHPSGKLTWSHYRRIIRIPEPAVRQHYTDECARNAWSVRQLEAQIADGAHTRQIAEPKPDHETSETARLVAKRGDLRVYRIADKPGVGRVLDLGFRVSEALAGHDDPGFEVGTVVASEQTGKRLYRFSPSERRRRLYSYPAIVTRIIDADTFWVTIDCGFGTFSDQKVRLRGIDSPELETPAGLRARDFVVNALASSPTIVISTTKVDLYDRYLSDILYLPDETDVKRIVREGRFLNRELIDAGHARPWTRTPSSW